MCEQFSAMRNFIPVNTKYPPSFPLLSSLTGQIKKILLPLKTIMFLIFSILGTHIKSKLLLFQQLIKQRVE